MSRVAHQLDHSAGHLHAAAAAAENHPGGSPDPVLRTLAALARATAALISSTPQTPDADLGFDAHLAAALDALDAIEPGDGPPDLPLLAWHVHDLRHVAAQATS